MLPDAALPGAPGPPWITPRRDQSETELDFGFGSATAVFHSLQSGAGVSGETGEAAPPAPAPPQHISLPPYMAGIPLPGPQGGIPLPGPQGAQHIHINNFTANLNFPPAPATTANSSQSGKGV